MPARSKKHHYVPQCLLRQFSIDGLGKQIHVLDKRTDAVFPAAIKDVACETNFNTFLTDGERHSFEAYYQPYDDALAAILATLAEARDLRALKDVELLALSHIVAVQLTRTKLARTSVPAFAAQMRERLRESGLGEGIGEMPIPSEEDVRRVAAATLNDHARLVRALMEKDLVLIESRRHEFWLSDNPVVLNNSFPYGMLGVGSPGSEVYLPLSPTLCLGLFCQSIGRKIPAYLNLPIPEATRVKYSRLAQSISDGIPMDLGPELAVFVNECLVLSSHRFLYASSPDFGAARSILAKHPDLRDVQTLTTVGAMGQGLPRMPRMPMGMWAVFEGTLSHCAIPVVKWDRQSEPLEFVTPMRNVREELAACGELTSLTIYEDQVATRGMREVTAGVVVEGEYYRVRIEFQDEGLNHLMRQIRER